MDESRTARQLKTQMLIRMNRGRTAIPLFLAALSDALGDTLTQDALVPLAETDLLTQSFVDGYQAAIKDGVCRFRRLFSLNEEEVVFGIVQRLAERLQAEVGFLIAKQSEDCGAVKLPIALLLKHAASILRLDGDSLSALSLSGTEGVLLDYNADHEAQAYEIAVWGDRWPIVALACETPG